MAACLTFGQTQAFSFRTGLGVPLRFRHDPDDGLRMKMTNAVKKTEAANLRQFQNHLSARQADTLAIRQLAADAFCLESADKRDTVPLYLSEDAGPAPRLFRALEDGVRFAKSTFQINRIYLHLIADA